MSINITAGILEEFQIVAVKILPSARTTFSSSYHLALLLDCSGSMEGERMSAMKRTLHLLIDGMRDEDRLTIISYASEASIVASAVEVGSRADLHSCVDELIPDGGTNLEAALLSLHTASRDPAFPTIDSVFLLTDGYINQGFTSSTGLQRILTSALKPGTPVNTLGFGSTHNSALLRDMAMRSRGSYTYADASEMLPAIIGDIVSGMENTVGVCGALQIPEGWTCLEMGSKNGVYSTGNLIAEKPQWIVLRGPPDAVAPTFTFTYTVNGVIETLSVQIDPVAVPKIEVAEQWNRTLVASVFARVSSLLESGETAAARTVLTELQTSLESSLAKDRTFVVRLRAQVDEMLSTIMPSVQDRLQRQRAYNENSADLVSATLSRMASNTAALGTQRGFFTTSSRDDPNAFSTPLQRQRTACMTQRYIDDPE